MFDTAVRAVASTLLRHRPTTLVRTVTVIVQQWCDSLADLVSPMSPLGSCKVLVQQWLQQWFDSLADLVSPMSPLSSCKVLVQQRFDTLADPVSPMSPLGSLQDVRLAA